jgi:hypothetical protein
MRVVRPLIVSGSLLATLALFAACQATPLPGTNYGTYKVTGTTQTNSCGTDLGAPDPWVFDVEVSKDAQTLYWSWMDGNAPLSGTVLATSAILTTSTTGNVDPTDAGAGPCTMTRADTVDVTLPSGGATPPASLTGTITYSFTAPAGSSCADQLTSAGGQYAALPCTLAYTFAAAHQ